MIRAGRLADAIGVLSLDAELYSRSATVHAALGEAYDRQGERALAIDSYQKAVEIDPTDGRSAERMRKLKGG